MKLPQFDYTPLTTAKMPKVKRIMWFAGGAFVLAIFLPIISIGTSATTAALITALLYVLIFLSIIAAVVAALMVSKARKVALTNFTAANQITYNIDVNNPSYAGVLFQTGHSRSIMEQFLVMSDGSPIEIGNYRYTTGSGKNSTTHHLGYVKTKLPRQLPHFLLDAKANNIGIFSNIPQYFNSDQKLQLEGDFNNYFTLYTPDGYQRDALYVFTPDVMAALVDHAANFDIEISGDDLYIYNSGPFDLIKADVWQKLFTLIGVIHPELSSQTDNYSDERIGDKQLNTVAPAGQSLKRGFNYRFGLAVAAFFAASYISFFLDINSGLQILIFLIPFFGIWGFVGYVIYQKAKRK